VSTKTALSLALVAALGLVALDAPAAGQPASAERAPKTAIQLQRDAGHVWDLALPGRVAETKPLRSRAFRAALEAHEAGQGDVRHDLAVSWGEFLSGTGEPFLALALDRPTDADLAPGTKATVFGQLLDAAGTAVAGFEADDQVELSAGHSLVDVSIPVPATAVKAVLGLALRGQVRWLVEQPLALAPIDAATFGVSPAILSLDVRPLAEPQRPDDPFCFGGLRVAPRGDRTFRKGESPWLFTVVRAPGSEPSAVPKLAAELVIRAAADGKERRYPVGGLTPTPLRGFASQWGLGIALPLANLPPGDYQAALEVKQAPGGEHGTAATDFTVVEN
jgi:hypothetical protein